MMPMQESFGPGTFGILTKLKDFLLENPGSFRGEIQLEGILKRQAISVLVAAVGLKLVRLEIIKGRYAKYWWDYEGDLEKFRAKKKTGIPRRSRIDTPMPVSNKNWKEITRAMGYPTGTVGAQSGKRYCLKG